MSIANVWPLIFVLLVPVIVLLYILKQKGTDQEVSSTMLWQEIIKNMEATTPWEKYKHNILMYLQIATVLLLMLALMAPFLKQGGEDFAQVVIVLDDSASMNAIYEDEITRFDEAKVRAKAYIESLNENCAITLMTATGHGEILATNVTDKQAAKKLIDRLQATDLAGSANSCMDMVRSVAAQWEGCGVTIFTDTAVELRDTEATIVNLYSPGDNLSVDYLSYAPNEDGTITALAQVTNYSAVSYDREVNLYGDGNLLDIQQVTVPANDTAVVYFENIKFQGVALEAQINEKDLLSRDNTAGVIVNGSASKRVLLVTGGNTFLEMAFNTVPGVDLYKTADMSVVGKNETFDLYVFDGCMPETVPASGNIIYINPTGNEEIKVLNTVESVMLSFAASELSQYLEEVDIGVNEAIVLERPVWANSLLTYGEDCCGYYGEDGIRRNIVLGFDIHNSDFALQPEFPILIYNIANYALASDLVDVDRCITGDKVQLYSRGYDTDLAIVIPSGETVVMESELASKVYTEIDYVGLYRVSQKVEEQTLESCFYANFPVEQESNVVRGQDTATADEGSDSTPSGGRDLRDYIIFALMALLMLEWFIYTKEY